MRCQPIDIILQRSVTTADIATFEGQSDLVMLRTFKDSDSLIDWATFCTNKKLTLAVDCAPDILEHAAADLDGTALSRFIFTRAEPTNGNHAVGDYRKLVEVLRKIKSMRLSGFEAPRRTVPLMIIPFPHDYLIILS